MELSELPSMGCVLSKDSKLLSIEFDEKPNPYTAEQVETLIYLLMHQRSKMLPSVQPLTGAPVPADRVLVADAYLLQVDPEMGALQVWMQHSGFGWGLVTIPTHDAAKLGQELLDFSKTKSHQEPDRLQ